MAGSQNNTLTLEQVKILDCFSVDKDSVITAYAGSGKTFILKKIAELSQCKNLRLVYIAFNKAIVKDAKNAFGKNVFCTTMHSLAYRGSPNWLIKKLNPKTISFREIKKYLDLNSLFPDDFKIEMEKLDFSEKSFFQAAMETLKRFESSGSKTITDFHIPFLWKQKMNPQQLVKTIEIAAAVWKAKISEHNDLPINHDTYVKYWHLNNPEIDCDLILFDEAQDASGVFTSIVAMQKCKKIYVGDTHQQIYSWRGAVNALKKVEGEKFYLTKSFRFGPSLAHFATKIMAIKGEFPPVMGLETLSTKVHFGNKPSIPETYTHIFRTNGGIIEEAQFLLEEGTNFFTNVDFRSLLRQISCAYSLYIGEEPVEKDQLLDGIESWEELLELSEISQDLVFLKNFIIKNKHSSVKVIKNVHYGLLKIQESTLKPKVLLTTGHKSKGLEWENVVLDDDFKIFFPKENQKDTKKSLFLEEVNLLYVSATRATQNLYVPKEIEEIVERLNNLNKDDL